MYNPTPATVALAIANREIAESEAYRDQVENARAYSKRVADARDHGYRGPLTRKELAARCARMQRDANS